jgi:hypothetical protein
VLSLVRQIQEVEDIGVAEIILGGQRRLFHLGNFLFRFGLNRRFVLAGQQAFLIKFVDLPFQRSGTPVLFDCFLLMPIPGVRIFNANQFSIMHPT